MTNYDSVIALFNATNERSSDQSLNSSITETFQLANNKHCYHINSQLFCHPPPVSLPLPLTGWLTDWRADAAAATADDDGLNLDYKSRVCELNGGAYQTRRPIYLLYCVSPDVGSASWLAGALACSLALHWDLIRKSNIVIESQPCVILCDARQSLKITIPDHHPRHFNFCQSNDTRIDNWADDGRTRVIGSR